MGTLEIINRAADSCYLWLTLNFLWGAVCIIVAKKRLGQLGFRSLKVETEYLDQLEEMLRNRQYKEVTELCDYDFRALPRLVLLLVANRDQSYKELRQMVATNVQRHFLGDLENKLGSLVVVIKSGPLLGLMGTVLGMMAAFGRIGTGEKVQPSQIAQEISVALICTAMGLLTAIPFGYVLSYLSIKVRGLQDSLDASLGRILPLFNREEG